MLADFATAISTARTTLILDDIAKLMWRALAAGTIDEPAAERFTVAIEARRAVFRANRAAWTQKPMQGVVAPSRTPTSPDRAKSIERRRRHAASGALPPDIAASFTIGEQAVLSVIARQFQQTGSCTWFMDKIAAIAGVCRTTVRNAIRQAQALGLITVKERRIRWWRNDSNIVRLVARGWIRWLKGSGCKKTTSTDTQIYKTVNNKDNPVTFPVRSCLLKAETPDNRHGKHQEPAYLLLDP